jgi:hypothetical protein
MYKIHRPHIQSGYLSKVQYKTIIGQDGTSDWIMYYYPGEKALAEYEQFTTKKASRRTAEQLEAGGTGASDSSDEAKQLVMYFYHRIQGFVNVAPTARAYKQAQRLIAEYGLTRAKFVVDYVDQHRSDTGVKPHHFGFIISYASQAITEYERHQTSQEKLRAQQVQEMLHDAYQIYRDQQVAEIRAHIPPDELNTIRKNIQILFDQNDTTMFGRNRMIEIEIDKVLEQRYGVPSFDLWREQNRRMTE